MVREMLNKRKDLLIELSANLNMRPDILNVEE